MPKRKLSRSSEEKQEQKLIKVRQQSEREHKSAKQELIDHLKNQELSLA